MGGSELLERDHPPEGPLAGRPALDFPVVGIGGSAGAVGALQRFFDNLPASSGMAYVIVLHLSPRHESELDSILRRSTRMPVLQVSETVAIEADHVYVISPAQQLSMVDGHLHVAEVVRQPVPPVAVDIFFRSLAETQFENSMCVLLSGTGSDGSVGIKRIRECGGVTLVQSAKDAEFSDMPLNAIATGVVDFVLPVAEIPQQLIDLWGNAQQIELPAAPGGPASTRPIVSPESAARAEEAVRQILAGLHAHTRNDFSHYKRGTVLRRLERRMQVQRVPTLQAYHDVVQAQPAEYDALMQDLLISVTSFFRDREAFDALQRELESSLAGHAASRQPVRAWIAGCATGEEAYSVAILLCEQFAADKAAPAVQVFASDIDSRAVDAGRTGSFPGSIVADVTPSRLRQFFIHEDGHFRVRRDLREAVVFSVHNLLRDPPFSRLDLLCCRNLLIYLEREVQQRILQIFHFALCPGGLLFLGTAESAEAAPDLFDVVDRKNRIFRARRSDSGTKASLAFAALPARQLAAKFAPVASGARSDLAKLHERLLADNTPASLLVNDAGHIVHLSQRASKFLRHVGGAPSHHLLALIRPELRIELRTAMSRAWNTGQSVEAGQVVLDIDGRSKRVRIVAVPCPDARSESRLMLLRLIESDSSLANDTTRPEGRDPMLDELENELQATGEQLRGSLGISEISTEELRASNEELQAINEALRSATEELETSKEELQSVNEELISLNDELSSRADETGKVNDDLSNLIASTDIATVFVDRAMRIKRFTPRATELFNLRPSDVGRPLLDITHRLDYPQLVDDTDQTFRTLRQIEREVTGAGNRRFLARVLPYRTHEDHIDGAVLTFVDVSALRQAEAQLRIGEMNMRLVAESATDYAIITLDLAGRVTHWSKGAERLFGYAEAEMLGRPADAIFLPEDRAAGAPADEMRGARETGRGEDERWHLRKDGTRVFCSGIMTPLATDGELYGYAKIARDLTGSKLVEEQREALLASEKLLRAELQRAATLKDEFLAVMSHELKHPLNLIHVNAELLTRLPEVRDSPAVARAANVIRRTVFSQAKIIDDLLDLSRLHTGKLALNFAPVDWRAIIARVVDAVQVDAEAKALALRTDLDPRAALVVADWVRVEQIVWNLVSNALKFTPRGGTIDVRLSLDAQMARLDVADSGRGIEAGFLANVFDMFRQATSGTARQEGGLGIGLALVKHLADEHGGRVGAASDGLGKGATLSVWLPMAGKANERLWPARGEQALSAMRILVVDDTDDTLDAFATLLRLEGAEVDTATSGEAALSCLAARPAGFDLVLSDIGMPGMDGYELVRRIRSQESTRAVPVIALTGFGPGVDTVQALAAGFDAHLTKPVSLSRLLDTIERLRVRPRSGTA